MGYLQTFRLFRASTRFPANLWAAVVRLNLKGVPDRWRLYRVVGG
jgi:hypothetical protein